MLRPSIQPSSRSTRRTTLSSQGTPVETYAISLNAISVGDVRGHPVEGVRICDCPESMFDYGPLPQCCSRKLRPCGIRAVRENQRIIRCDARDCPTDLHIYR